MASRVQQIFGVGLTLQTFFEQPTPTRLAEYIDMTRRNTQQTEVPPLAPTRRSVLLPLSFAQQRLWFLDQLEPGSPYHIPAAVRLRGSLHVAALEQSINEVVQRHEALRTTFIAVDGHSFQIIANSLTIPLYRRHVQGDLEPERTAEILREAGLEAERPFWLSKGPLLRSTLLDIAEDDHVLLLTLHHIIADGWSIEILIHEIAHLYTAASMGQPASLPPLPIQYADFACWQREWLQGKALETQMKYWKEQLRGALPLELPTDRPRPAIQTFRGATRSIRLPEVLS